MWLAWLSLALAALGLLLQTIANVLLASGSPPEYFPGGEPGADTGGIIFDDQREMLMRAILRRERESRLAQRVFNASGCALFLATISSMAFAIPQTAKLTIVILGGLGAFVTVLAMQAVYEWQISKRHESKLFDQKGIHKRES